MNQQNDLAINLMDVYFKANSIFNKEFVESNNNHHLERLKKQRNAISNPTSSRKNMDKAFPS